MADNELFGISEQLDTISRRAALDAINANNGILYDNPTLVASLHKILLELPPAQQWIPVTERLPEGICQVIAQTNGGAIHDVLYEGKNAYGHEVWMRLDGGIYWDDEVVAWMPLPASYRQEGDDNHEG